MPELPDITIYIEALQRRILGERLEQVRLNSPFLLRTSGPPLDVAAGKTVRELRRLGKRIAIGLDDELWLVVHLMIAGRWHWKPPGAKLAGKYNLAAFDFVHGTLLLTEAGSKRRASQHVVRGESDLRNHDPGGLDVLTASEEAFRTMLRQRNHTLKRALTDPGLVQLLPRLPDTRADPGGPVAFPAAQGRLAKEPRRTLMLPSRRGECARGVRQSANLHSLS